MVRKDADDRALKVLARIPADGGLYANSFARALLRDLIEAEIREHARLAVERARKARRRRGS